MNYQTVFFDFDGVLCKDKFYSKTLLPDYKKEYDWIETNIFSDKKLVGQWMRNQINSDDINKLVVQGTGIDREMLSKYYTDSIRKMELNAPVADLARSLKKRGCKIGIVTDNMDVFTQIIIPNHQLDNYLM
jgi:phosphoglycolate phosphatase-like HAD superfamily hydrolase